MRDKESSIKLSSASAEVHGHYFNKQEYKDSYNSDRNYKSKKFKLPNKVRSLSNLEILEETKFMPV